jgi:hypothetical protein
MSTKLHDVANNTVLGAGLYPQSLGSGANNGSVIDLITGDGRCFAIQMAGAVSGTSPTLSGKIQEGTLSDGSDMADVSGATFTQVTAATNVQCITFERTKRYVRYVGTIGGSSTPTVLTSAFIGEQKKQV